MKTKLCIFAIFTFIFFILVLFLRLNSKKINISIPGKVYALSAENYKIHNTDTVIHIDGEIHNKIFGKPVFKGSIWVDAFDMSTSLSDYDESILIDNKFFYEGKSENDDFYVYLDDNYKKVALMFISGIYVVGPVTDENDVENILNQSWGYSKVNYKMHTFKDIINEKNKFSFDNLIISQTTKNQIIDQYGDYTLLTQVTTSNSSILEYQAYFYFKDVGIASDNIKFIFSNNILSEISIKFNYKDEKNYKLQLELIKKVIDNSFNKLENKVYQNKTYYEDQIGNQFILQEYPTDKIFIIRIKDNN